jgi:lysophospholipase L1-like esterase
VSARDFGCFVALGDSLSAGIGGQTPWPDLAAAALRRRRPGLRFHNFARMGVTSHEVAVSQLGPALELAPDVVSLVCGANDVLLSVRPQAAEYEATLAAMLERIEATVPGALVVTATYPAIAPGALRPRSRERVVAGIGRFNAITRAVAAQHGARCLSWDAHPGVSAQPNFAADGFHPSQLGHDIAARAFAEAVASARVAAAA